MSIGWGTVLQGARFMGYGEDLRLWLRLTLVRLVGLSDDKGLVLGRVRFPGWQMSGRVGQMQQI